MKSHKSKPRNYWTKDLCIEEGLKYDTRKEFYNKSSGAYRAAIRNNWIIEVSKHMNV